MVMYEDIPRGEFKVTLGKSFREIPNKKQTNFFEMKSDSRVNFAAEATLEKDKINDKYRVRMRADEEAIFNAEVVKTEEYEYLLIYNKQTESFTLERQSAIIQLKDQIMPVVEEPKLVLPTRQNESVKSKSFVDKETVGNVHSVSNRITKVESPRKRPTKSPMKKATTSIFRNLTPAQKLPPAYHRTPTPVLNSTPVQRTPPPKPQQRSHTPTMSASSPLSKAPIDASKPMASASSHKVSPINQKASPHPKQALKKVIPAAVSPPKIVNKPITLALPTPAPPLVLPTLALPTLALPSVAPSTSEDIDDFDISRDMDEILDNSDDDDDDDDDALNKSDSDGDVFEEITNIASAFPPSTPQPKNITASPVILPRTPSKAYTPRNATHHLAVPSPVKNNTPSPTVTPSNKRTLAMASAPIRHPGDPTPPASKKQKFESSRSESGSDSDSSSGSESSSGSSTSGSDSDSSDDDMEELVQDISMELSKDIPSEQPSPSTSSYPTYKKSPYDSTNNGPKAPMSLRALCHDQEEDEDSSSSSSDSEL
ncbi:hypothetical protein BDB01DRAFT_854034 [Pilobolus umbonatus]|nr:hypothetical protein BDB01DRAFT_854034 [Pilobolus umbonatus]